MHCNHVVCFVVLTLGPQPTCHHRSSTGSGRTASTPSLWWCLRPLSEQSSGYHPSSRWRHPRVQRLRRCSCFWCSWQQTDAPTPTADSRVSAEALSCARQRDQRERRLARGSHLPRTLSRALVSSCTIWVRNRWANMCHITTIIRTLVKKG